MKKQEENGPKLSHLDAQGLPKMVNVIGKTPSLRKAHARSEVIMPPVIIKMISGNEIHGKKGPVFQTAIIAGTMAAKKTAELIPLCHPLNFESCNIAINFDGKKSVVIDCHVSIEAKTGVEMEALIGANIAALTIYDMLKALSHEMVITNTRLIKKEGGKSTFSSI